MTSTENGPFIVKYLLGDRDELMTQLSKSILKCFSRFSQLAKQLLLALNFQHELLAYLTV